MTTITNLAANNIIKLAITINNNQSPRSIIETNYTCVCLRIVMLAALHDLGRVNCVYVYSKFNKLFEFSTIILIIVCEDPLKNLHSSKNLKESKDSEFLRISERSKLLCLFNSWLASQAH
jgi:hypothetical protein